MRRKQKPKPKPKTAGQIWLVCGGREYDGPLASILRHQIQRRGIPAIVVVGGAKGADRRAEEWFVRAGIHVAVVPALWDSHKKAAGPIRNSKMLLLKPDLVIAFPGGAGTADMVRKARAAGVKVMKAKVLPDRFPDRFP